MMWIMKKGLKTYPHRNLKSMKIVLSFFIYIEEINRAVEVDNFQLTHYN